ncbi:LamG-like jellyroll fold domain-containing protein [Pontibacillus salipaludis]|uniref:beta-fructofuranosidase n=1 Tax=Pontibacillus salipaludis TaxID=1697394 RepID=A0ABQ1Q4L8_9BACI|nr:LamG-like jellyroll fold domain-containing protein [Pontibacillus salipaludis]GGD13215.1 hypothetical protein GCM10011389_21000 [Pontibacillus salipaludis]
MIFNETKHALAHWVFNEGRGNKVNDAITQKQDPIHYVFSNHSIEGLREPQWRKGIADRALLFDGYSTWIEREANMSDAMTDAFTIEAWIAPRSFGGNEDERLTGIVSQHDRKNKQGFILGLHQHGRWGLQLGTGEDWMEVWSSKSLPIREWSHVVATFSGAAIALYLNGERVAYESFSDEIKMEPFHGTFYIGRHNDPISIGDVFYLNTFAGLVDEVSLQDQALSDTDIKEKFDKKLQNTDEAMPAISHEEIAIRREVYDQDPHKPKYHITAPGHWMNEPHAPLYFNGYYHLFYQHNPQGPYWGNIQWGHWVSKDLVHWRDLPVAIETEDDDLAPDGIWSGNATYAEDGTPVLFFTAGNKAKAPNQMTGLARSTYTEDKDLMLTKWEKHPEPVTLQPQGEGLHHDGFRDPFVWKDGDTWYQIVASGLEGVSGAVLLFTSTNLVDWEYKGILRADREKKYPYLGEVWELPILLPISEEKHIFIISPVGNGADVEVFYWIGKWDASTLTFAADFEEPKLMDLGDFHFTGPSAMKDPKTGRVILFTIAQGRRSLQEEFDAGWAHNGGLPVELWLREDGQLGMKPIEELQGLRGEKLLSFENGSLGEANEQVAHVKGDQLEIRLKVRGDVAGVKVRKSNDGSEETLVYYNRRNETLNVRKVNGEEQGGTLSIGEDVIDLHIYVDGSMVECYANGLKSITTRTYPNVLAEGLELWGGDDITIVSLEVWEMHSIH